MTAATLAAAQAGPRPHHLIRAAAWIIGTILAVPLVALLALHGWAQWEIHRMAAEAAAKPRPELEQVSSTKLLDLPGHRVTAMLVKFPPGAHSPEHHHEATVFVYVLGGAIRSAVSDQAPGTFATGQSFEEPLGAIHFYASNASETDPAVALAVFVHKEGARLTVFH